MPRTNAIDRLDSAQKIDRIDSAVGADIQHHQSGIGRQEGALAPRPPEQRFWLSCVRRAALRVRCVLASVRLRCGTAFMHARRVGSSIKKALDGSRPPKNL